VGSFKQGTILAGHRTADFVVILKTFPTKEAVEALHTKVADDLKATDCKEHLLFFSFFLIIIIIIITGC